MTFTYDAYQGLLHLLLNSGYTFCSYENYPRSEFCVIMRHDIDYSLEQALELARVEKAFGVKATYFVLLTSDFYNPASASANRILREIMGLGHNIGIHFDETAYSYDTYRIEYYIRKETRALSDLLDINVNCFSLHRPNVVTLESQLKIPGLINAYGDEFFRHFKYISDSRRRWREPVEDIIVSRQYERLHILTHAFWYHNTDQSIQESITRFINCASEERRETLKSNITGLDEIIAGQV